MPSSSAATPAADAARADRGTRPSASRKALTPRSSARQPLAPARAAPRPAPAPPSPPSPASNARGRRVGDDPARVHHQHAVGEQQRLGHVVRDHDRGQPEPVVQRADRACRARRASPDRARRTARPSAAASARSPARARRRRAGAARPTARRASAPRSRAGRSTSSSSSATRAAVALARQPQPDRDILGDGHVREQPDILEHIADPPPQRGAGRPRSRPRRRSRRGPRSARSAG